MSGYKPAHGGALRKFLLIPVWFGRYKPALLSGRDRQKDGRTGQPDNLKRQSPNAEKQLYESAQGKRT